MDTDEIEKITEIIGSQKGYTNAYILPDLLKKIKYKTIQLILKTGIHYLEKQ